MTEPARPQLKLIDRVIEQVPQSENPAVRTMERKALQRYLPAITKENYATYEAELTRSLGGYTLEQLKARKLNQDAHESELDRLTKERIQWIKEAKAHGFWRGISVGAVILVPAAVFGMWGVMTLTRMDVIAAQRVQATPAWTPPADNQPQGFRP